MLGIIKQLNQFLLRNTAIQSCTIRCASKKANTGSRNQKGHARPKHRGWRVQDGEKVQAGTLLATQRTLRFLPGLNVGFGKNGTLFAIIPGQVMVTCEKPDFNWDHTWVQRHYGGRINQSFYKKYFNILPEKQHQNFKLIEQI